MSILGPQLLFLTFSPFHYFTISLLRYFIMYLEPHFSNLNGSAPLDIIPPDIKLAFSTSTDLKPVNSSTEASTSKTSSIHSDDSSNSNNEILQKMKGFRREGKESISSASYFVNSANGSRRGSRDSV